MVEDFARRVGSSLTEAIRSPTKWFTLATGLTASSTALADRHAAHWIRHAVAPALELMP